METSTPSNSDKKPLSCVHCRQRKVKCTRIYPCEQCVRQQLECYFPSRKKHERKRPRRQDELLGRLARLEAIVGQAESSGLDASLAGLTRAELEAPVAPVFEPLVATAPAASPGAAGPPPSSQNASDPANRYLSRDFWLNLCSEVEGMKQALEQPSESDEDEPEDESSPGSQQSASTPSASHGILGTPNSIASDAPPQQSKQQAEFLRSTYWANVDPVFKILHRPSVEPAMKAYVASTDTSDAGKATEALYLAMYFGAVVSLPASACLEHLGQERSVLCNKYRLAAERALTRADYLNSSRLESLQAFTLYLACLRTDERGRSSWALLALAIRLAHALTLHRDGSVSAFSPFEAEMRRRLWWQLIILDVRAVEDRGSQPIIPCDSYSTKMLTNINDADFGPSTTEPLVGVEGPTDVTFLLCSAMASNIFLYLCDPNGRFGAANKSGQVSYPETEEEIINGVQQLETMFLGNINPEQPSSVLASGVVRIIVLKLWLAVQYPFQVRISPAVTRPRVSREDMLRTAVAVMELSEASIHSPLATQFGWWTETYVQWHPLVVALVELCAQPQGELPDRAWLVVDRILPQWGARIADTKRGSLWRPIRKLVKKARAARLESQLRGLGLGQDVNYRVITEAQEPAPSTSQQIGGGAGKQSIDEAPSPSGQGIYSLGSPLQALAQQPMDWLSMDWTLNIDYGAQDTNAQGEVDWSTWNEFILDTNADCSPPGAVDF